MLSEFNKKIIFLIDQNLHNLEKSHLDYGGVYLARIQENENVTSLEIELDEGNIAFSLSVDPKACPHCGGKEFKAHQQIYMNVIVDANNHFLRNASNDCIYDASHPYGAYTCLSCSFEMEDLPTNLIEDVAELLKSSLMAKGIGVYEDYSDWEEALNS